MYEKLAGTFSILLFLASYRFLFFEVELFSILGSLVYFTVAVQQVKEQKSADSLKGWSLYVSVGVTSTTEYFKSGCCVLQELTLSAVLDPEPKGAEIIKLFDFQ